jgi:hypothetical protein
MIDALKSIEILGKFMTYIWTPILKLFDKVLYLALFCFMLFIEMLLFHYKLEFNKFDHYFEYIYNWTRLIQY